MTLPEARDHVLGGLLGLMSPGGFWEGHLSSSALSTATAISALSMANDPTDRDRITHGLRWLAEHQNADGGWGDTFDSPTNLPTTLLVVSAFSLGSRDHEFADVLKSARLNVHQAAGDTPADIGRAVISLYGSDRTFATPILMNCALAGIVPWEIVPPLPYALAAMPQALHRTLRLQVVSYALPALISIGLAVAQKQSSCIACDAARSLLRNRLLAKLATVQPESGGFLEATPLTSFVAMALCSYTGADHPIVHRCLSFLRASQRGAGGWPIDSNLSIWLTSAAVCAITSAEATSMLDLDLTRRWLADQQQATVHPYTAAAPGGWGWTHLSGSVPDADDTAGAIIALSLTGGHPVIANGVRWLLGLQNRDGGWPTFCRGWGKLPFDQSAADLTAHALRALVQAGAEVTSRPAIDRGVAYLLRTQRSDGSWVPLWFGSQLTRDRQNPVLGTSRVLRAMEQLQLCNDASRQGVRYLLGAQNEDGGWGAAGGVRSSVEETAQALAALSGWMSESGVWGAVARATEYLLRCIESGELDRPSPIGLYFASLWYSERLYPMIWTLEALGRVQSARRGCDRGIETWATRSLQR